MGSKTRPNARPTANRSRGKPRRLGFWVLIALALHVELGLGLVLWSYFYAPRNAELDALRAAMDGESIELGMLDGDAAREILAELDREAEKEREEAVKKEVEAKKPPGQVVELPRPAREERPEDAKFAAEFDSKVEKETRKFGDLKKNARMGSTSGADQITTPEVPASQPETPSPARPGPASKLLAMRNPGPQGAQQQPSPTGSGPRSPGSPSPEVETGPPDGDGQDYALGRPMPPLPPGGGGAPPGNPGSPGAPALMPSPAQVAQAIGSGTNDHLPDVDEGEGTALNAKKWKFASFFNRVKRQVRDHWRPAEEYRKRDPTFRIFGTRDRFTLLRVALKPDGSLATVDLETTSGIDFLDDEAVEAFKLAQPFPNPPRQLVEDGSGLISFRFGFYFEIGGGGANPRMKVFRYNDF